jgi:hypothetical protein
MGNCLTCLGMGCNDCCHTGLADTPPGPGAKTSPGPAQTSSFDIEPYARLAETGMVEPYLYRTDPVYHALCQRIYRGTPPDHAAREGGDPAT